MKIRRFETSDTDAIARLNARLAAKGIRSVVYPEGPEQAPGPVRQRLFVAADETEVRGGVWLKEHRFRAAGEDLTCGWLKYPVAESLIDPTFSGVPGSLLFHCLREQPRLMALGLGGHATPLARMLARLKWTGVTVPLLALLVRPGRALRELSPMRRSATRRAAARILGVTGAAWVGQRMLESARGWRSSGTGRGYTVEREGAFGSWADDIWQRCRDDYGFLAERNATMLNCELPVGMSDAMCLRVRRQGVDVGWAFFLRHNFAEGDADPNFGRLTVGLLADVLAHPSDAAGVVRASLDAVIDSGVDLVFTNQIHNAWIQACHDRGFISGPSNFAFYRAPGAQALIAGAGAGVDRIHVDRGDCDGPLWYAPRE